MANRDLVEPPLLLPFEALKGLGIDLSRDIIRRLAKKISFRSHDSLAGIALLSSRLKFARGLKP